MDALFDTNIIIDYLNGIELARGELQRYRRVFISPITFVEVLVGTSPSNDVVVRAFLSRFTTTELSSATLETAIRIRTNHRVRVPDALVRAAAEVNGLLLVTRNTKDFPPKHPGVRIPYSLS
ncbi:MAG: type II toxin-antitoxin system VapC family toxin [Spirochaeta sp.]|nr:type II toxin-antitoxin system VapC family toxin [Spirochaeta sp.]